MALDIFQSLDVIQVFENYVESIRPPLEIRHELDISYRIDDQSIILFEIRPHFEKTDVVLEHDFAKTTFVKSKNYWKVFWHRSNGNWDAYSPMPIVQNLKEFIKLVEDDKYSCFFG